MNKKNFASDIFVKISAINAATNHASIMKFMLVGALNTLIGYIIFATLLYLRLHYTAAVLIANIAIIGINFNSYGRLVFNSRDNSLIFRFALVYVIIYIINVVILSICSLLSINLYLVSLIMTLPFALLSYFLNCRFVFRPSSYSAAGLK